MAGKQAEISLQLQLEEAERKGREEGMAALFAALSTADTGEQVYAFGHHHDNNSNFKTRVNITMVEAADDDDTELVLFLLKSGADINTFNQAGHTALHCAVKTGGNIQLVKALLKAGANVNLTNDHRVTPFACAVEEGHTEIAKALLAAGADVRNGRSFEGYWLIDYEAEGDHVEMTQLLIEGGAFIGSDKKNQCWTPLMLASQNGKAKAAALLIKAGCDVNAQDGDGTSVLMLASFGDQEGALETLRLLLIAGAEVNLKSKEGCTALINAAEAGHSEAVRLLLSAGADVFSRAKARDSRWGEPARKAGNAFDVANDNTVKQLIKNEMHRRIAAALSALPSMPVGVRQKIMQLYIEE